MAAVCPVSPPTLLLVHLHLHRLMGDWTPGPGVVDAVRLRSALFNGTLPKLLDTLRLPADMVRQPDPVPVLQGTCSVDAVLARLLEALVGNMAAIADDAVYTAVVGALRAAAHAAFGLEKDYMGGADEFDLMALFCIAGEPKQSLPDGAPAVDGPFMLSCFKALHDASLTQAVQAPPVLRLYWLRKIVAAARLPEARRRDLLAANPDLPAMLMAAAATSGGGAAAAVASGGRSGKARAGAAEALDGVSRDHAQRVAVALKAVAALCGAVGAAAPPPHAVQSMVDKAVKQGRHAGSGAAPGTRHPSAADATAGVASAVRCAVIGVQIRELKALTRLLMPHAARLEAAGPIVWQALLEYMLCAQGSPRNGTIDSIENQAAISQAEPVAIVQSAVVPAATLAALEEFAGRRLLSEGARARETAFFGAESEQVRRLLHPVIQQASAAVEARALGGGQGPDAVALQTAMLEAIHGLTALTTKYEFQTVVPEQLGGCPVQHG